jgi:hypothetical protein
MCRVQTKEHEAILHADVDARDIHAALEASGAKPGSPVRFQPKFTPPSGTTIKVMLEYSVDGKSKSHPAQRWIRNMKTLKELDSDWIFAGSRLYKDPDDPKKPPYYTANSGDVICVSNFTEAMLDLPASSPKDNGELSFEAWTDRIPPHKTPVTVILIPVIDAQK